MNINDKNLKYFNTEAKRFVFRVCVSEFHKKVWLNKMSVRKSAAATLQNGEGNAIIWSPGIEDKGKRWGKFSLMLFTASLVSCHRISSRYHFHYYSYECYFNSHSSVNEKMASSPRLKFQGGFHNLQVLLDKMNKAWVVVSAVLCLCHLYIFFFWRLV